MAQLSGYTLAVTDLESATEWYCTHFELTAVGAFDLPAYALRAKILATDDGWNIELLQRADMTPRERVSHPLDAALLSGYATVQLDVVELGTAFASLVDAGAEPLMPPHPGPSGLAAVIADPDGNLIRLREAQRVS